jgi:hypothetical protein
MHAGFWWVNFKERGQLEHLDTGGRIILKQILTNRMRRRELNSFGAEQKQEAGCCKYDNEPSISTKFLEFLDYLKKTISFSRTTLLHSVSLL